MKLHTLPLVLACTAGCAATQDTPNPAADVEHLVTTDCLAGPLRYLSHDLLGGRGVGTRGDDLSRLYLASQMEMLGLQPAGPDGGWEQPVPILGITADITGTLTVRGEGGSRTFSAPTDYVAFAARPEERTAWEDAEVVFVGYGIDAPEQDWDDYGDADVEGKVLLVMNNDPSDDPDLFEGRTRLYYGRWSYKYEEAARRGAVGAIVIHTTPSAGYPFQVIQAQHGREQFWLPFDEATPHLQVRSWCSEEAARAICSLGGKDLDELRSAAQGRDFQPVPLGVAAGLTLENEVREIESANVLGRIEGTDRKDEAVVITAHFDHLGIGNPKRGDEIYNGALDNASGCAAALAIARACSRLDEPPRRSLLFLFVTAEESGLLGSKYYARHPTVPREKLIANYNFDGINIWGPAEDVEMVGYGKNSLTRLTSRVAERRGRRLEPEKRPELGMFYRSDHFSFARIGVPSAYLKAGNDFYDRKADRRRIKNSYTAVRYHQPQDEFDDRWNLEGAVLDTRLVLECLLRTANDDEPPHWAPGDEFEKLR